MATPAMARTATPPTTLPAMTPALLERGGFPLGKVFGEEVGEGMFVGVDPGLAESEGRVVARATLPVGTVADVRPAIVIYVSRATSMRVRGGKERDWKRSASLLFAGSSLYMMVSLESVEYEVRHSNDVSRSVVSPNLDWMM